MRSDPLLPAIARATECLLLKILLLCALIFSELLIKLLYLLDACTVYSINNINDTHSIYSVRIYCPRNFELNRTAAPVQIYKKQLESLSTDRTILKKLCKKLFLSLPGTPSQISFGDKVKNKIIQFFILYKNYIFKDK